MVGQLCGELTDTLAAVIELAAKILCLLLGETKPLLQCAGLVGHVCHCVLDSL